ncbi:hypothetical protein D7X88_05400 [bacterium C-53]|nr:hypothetical protein [Lachnospiraceae bacterium]RKJ11295.1 hypothetical protein D7X88_05400 [bacterium C-53]
MTLTLIWLLLQSWLKLKVKFLRGGGIRGKATYFVLVSTNFYNIFSKDSKEYISKIMECGGEIALHFDETQYEMNDEEELITHIIEERNILQGVAGMPVRVVSMHRPSKQFLTKDLKIEGIINAYGKEYFSEMKYISDSRRNWREDVDNLDFENYKRFCILTHPIWYDQTEKENIKAALYDQIIKSLRDKWSYFEENISNFETIFSLNEINILMEKIKRLNNEII